MTTTSNSSVFSGVADVVERYREHDYVMPDKVGTVVYLAAELSKPVLVEGPAGVGKTELAKTLAAVTGRRLVRLRCYEGQDDTKALYEWDYGKQLLYTQLLRQQIDEMMEGTSGLAEAAERLRAHEDVFFSEHFLLERPLLEAIRSEEPTVLLIDEIDRADEHLEALMLEVLAEYQVTVPELGTLTSRSSPMVIITSNATRDVSEALKRRCLHLSLGYPTAERELEILQLRIPGIAQELIEQVVEVVRGMRELDLRKAPSISEALDWARALTLLNVAKLDRETVESTITLLIKYERDVERVRQEIPRLLGLAGIDVPDQAPGHSHDHGHGHSHDHGHGHSHDHDHGESEARTDSTGYFGSVRGVGK